MKPVVKYGVAFFFVGLLVGGIVGRCLSPGFFYRRLPAEKRQERTLKRFGSKLNLNPEQRESIRKILASRREQIDGLLTEVRPKFEAIRNETADEIRKQLNGDQVQKYDEMHKRYMERWKTRFLTDN